MVAVAPQGINRSIKNCIKVRTLAEVTAFRNGTLQGAWLIMAARALGLDCGPMSGFDNAKADKIFFTDNDWKSNFLVNLGYGVEDKLHERGKRLDVETTCILL